MGGVTAILILSWNQLVGQPEINGLPAPLRKVLEWNGSLDQSLFNPKKLGYRPPAPAPTLEPRVNGYLGLYTNVNLETWRLKIQFPGTSFEMSFNDLRSLPKTRTTTEFKCIEGWSMPLSYAGVRFSDLLAHFPSKFRSLLKENSLPYVGLETPDKEYYVSIDLESMLHPQTVLAYEMNDQPLTLEHGAPLRLIIPVKYGIKSLKRIGVLSFSGTRPPDYWEERGYDWFSGL
jgi:DMSO/TMAO reductase YedYZ molybdopterin-dependent catalytic subunit